MGRIMILWSWMGELGGDHGGVVFDNDMGGRSFLVYFFLVMVFWCPFFFFFLLYILNYDL